MLLKVSVNPETEECPEGLMSETVHCNENQLGMLPVFIQLHYFRKLKKVSSH